MINLNCLGLGSRDIPRTAMKGVYLGQANESVVQYDGGGKGSMCVKNPVDTESVLRLTHVWVLHCSKFLSFGHTHLYNLMGICVNSRALSLKSGG